MGVLTLKLTWQEGAGSLLLGAPYRVVWMALRGAVFFGTLEVPFSSKMDTHKLSIEEQPLHRNVVW